MLKDFRITIADESTAFNRAVTKDFLLSYTSHYLEALSE